MPKRSLSSPLALGWALMSACSPDPKQSSVAGVAGSGGGGGVGVLAGGAAGMMITDAGGAAGTAGSGGQPVTPWPKAPPLTNPVALEGRALGEAALRILGSSAVGASGSCRECHSIGRSTLSKWRGLTDHMTESCLKKTSLPDRASVDAVLSCIRREPSQPDSTFEAATLGIYAAAAHLPWFSFVFEHRSMAGDWMTVLDEFKQRAGMPRSGMGLTQQDFDIVAAWFAKGLPGFLDLVPEDQGAGECTPHVAPELLSHIEIMGTAGWRTKNRLASVLMYGCKAGEQPKDCLAQTPLASATPYAQGWGASADFKIRLLRDNSDSLTLYWSRSSADGRYIGSGLRETGRAQVFDFQQNKTIGVKAGVDPGFFPDNSGFVFHGIDQGRGMVCEQSLLAGDPELVNGNEPECVVFNADDIGLYEQVARAVDGGDYWVASGIFESDDNGFDPGVLPPAAPFDRESAITLTPLVNQGNRFEVGKSTTIATPHEGDPVLSPSGTLLINRVKGKEVKKTVPETGEEFFISEQSGYAIHRMTTDRGAAGLTATLKSVARVCLTGGKPSVSMDERWMVLHHYVTKDDAKELGFADANAPAFQPFLEKSASNLYLVDLKSAAVTRLTHMAPGEFALFPHFRSDGWIYFVVRTATQKEYFAASDAALVLELR